jgi:hypothetical protein
MEAELLSVLPSCVSYHRRRKKYHLRLIIQADLGCIACYKFFPLSTRVQFYREHADIQCVDTLCVNFPSFDRSASRAILAFYDHHCFEVLFA